jgi:hypothetical protein
LQRIPLQRVFCALLREAGQTPRCCGNFSGVIFSKIFLLKVLLGFGFGLLILALL